MMKNRVASYQLPVASGHLSAPPVPRERVSVRDVSDFGFQISDFKLALAPALSGRTGRRRERRGTILVVALGIMLILAGLVVTLGREMSTEATASTNYSAGVHAAAIERGAEQYVIGMLLQLQQEGTTIYDVPDSAYAAVKIGDGYFWLVRPNYPNDPEFSQYGLVDESAKLNINYANEAELMAIPDVTQNMADAVLDWGGEQGGQDNSSYYGSLPTPYQSKQSPFESVEELLLVNGFTRQLLYGQSVSSTTPTIGLGQNAMPTVNLNTDPAATTGISDFLTVYSAVAGGTTGAAGTGGTGGTGGAPASGMIGGGGGTGGSFGGGGGFGGGRSAKAGPAPTAAPRTTGTGTATATGTGVSGAAAVASRPRVNINTAPREVLVAVMEGVGMPDSDADSVIAGRNLDDQDTSNAQSILGGDWQYIANYVTGTPGSQYSADIVAVSANGRAFKRVKIVVDTSQTTPTIIYRRDLTDRGWPLDPEILQSLRSGQPIDSAQDISEAGSSF